MTSWILLAILVDTAHPPVGVDVLFDLAVPGHGCRESDLCYAIISGGRKAFHHDVELTDGIFVQLFLWEYEAEQSTSRGSPSSRTEGSHHDSLDELIVPHPLYGANDEIHDESSMMQSQQRLVPDDGCTAHSQERLMRCSEMGLSWLVPARLHQQQMYNLWKYSGRDHVREHFIRQRYLGSGLSIRGWLFHDHQQTTGQPFAWGLSDSTPWAHQTGHLLRGTALDDVLMYAVVPQPEDFQLTLPDPASMQIIIPSLITDHLFQILVVEHDFSGTQSRQALRFEVPITVRQVFQASGFGCLCDAETRCTLQYMHGNCQKVFSDEEDVLLPFASFVRIMVHWIPSLPCTPFRPLVASDVVARQVAAAVHPTETFSFDRAVRQAREVLAQAAGDDEEDDLSTLMQRPTAGSHGFSDEDQHDNSLTSRETAGTFHVSNDVNSQQNRDRPQVGIEWMVNAHQVRMYLLEYASARRRPRNFDLVVHVLFHSFGHTRVSAACCPQWLLQNDVPVTRFLNWCQEYTRRLDARHSRLFHAVGEIYQNMPTLIVVYSMGEFTIPVIVQVLDPDPTSPPFVAVYLAGPSVCVATVVGWIREQMELAPAVFRYNGRQVAWREVLNLVAGGILQIRILSDEELNNPDTFTQEPGPGMTLTFEPHNTWSSTGSSLHYDIPQHTLGLDGRLRPYVPVPYPADQEGYPLPQQEDEETTFIQRKMTFRLVPVEEVPKDESTNNSFSDVTPWMLGDNTATPTHGNQVMEPFILPLEEHWQHHGTSRDASGYDWLRFGRFPFWIQRPLDRDFQTHWMRSPSEGLRPPGNPTCWMNCNLDEMDDWALVGGVEFVTDSNPSTRHGGQNMGCLPVEDEEQPCKISIFEALRPRDMTTSPAFQVETPSFAPWIEAVFVKRQLPNVSWNEIMEHLDTDIADEFFKVSLERPQDVPYVEIYTDGSFSKGKEKLASWAFVALCQVGTQKYMLGMDYGLVDPDPLSSAWTGAGSSTAREGENDALIRACEWSFAMGYEVPHYFYTDSTAAGYGASGASGTSVDDLQGRLSRSLAKALDAFLYMTEVHRSHVKAHSGIFGNELADAVAKWAFQQQPEEVHPRPDYTALLCGRRMAVEFLWMLFSPFSDQTSTTLPRWDGSAIHSGNLQQEVGTSHRLPPTLLDDRGSQVIMKPTELTVATYNVNTLDSKKGGMTIGFLREQVLWHDIDVMFLQESRTKTTQLAQSDTHYRATAAADQGQGGVETWLLRSRRRSGEQLFDRRSIHALVAEPELLLLKASYRGTSVLLINGHAPHTGAEPTRIKAFWQRLGDLIEKYRHTVQYYIMGVDANAHFCDASLPYVGCEGVEESQNLAGRCFLRLLARIDCYLPSTFEGVHQGESWTWISHANGAQARCDYLMIPREPQPVKVETWVIDSLDTGLRATDHRPLMMKILLPKIRCVYKRPRCSFDRRSLQKATTAEIDEALRDIPGHSWEEDIEKHATTLSEQVTKSLAKAFPAGKRGPRKSYISDETWTLRTARMQTRSTLQQVRDCIAALTVRKILHVWCYKEVLLPSQLFMEGIRHLAKATSLQAKSHQEAKDFKRALRADRTAWLEKIAKDAPQMSQSDFYQAMRNSGVRSRKKPGPFQPLPIVEDELGEPIFETDKLAERWRTFFAQQEDGIDQTPTQLMALCDSLARIPKLRPEWDDLPSFWQIEHQFRSTKVAFGKNLSRSSRP